MGIIFRSHMNEWKLKESDCGDCVQAMERRFMNLCRVVGQGEKKARQAPWVQMLPWGGSAQPAATLSAPSLPSSASSSGP
eukprot:9264628-Alexandrium_andersonii.AAC.1